MSLLTSRGYVAHYRSQNHEGSRADAARAGDLTPPLIETDVWSEPLLLDAGIPIIDAPLVSLGGGIGSFTLIDRLRICGLGTESLRVLTPLSTP